MITDILYGPELRIYIYTKFDMQIFIRTSIIIKYWKQQEQSSGGKCMNRMQGRQTTAILSSKIKSSGHENIGRKPDCMLSDERSNYYVITTMLPFRNGKSHLKILVISIGGIEKVKGK